ncbi:MAG TPA: DNA-3-methyladenine glycosylase I [Actinomycetes bacterium]|jgi:DNA-3-methyladenine glycosylase I|nr:DNA-3-methyladenine glycosylase I [Actinomycetes bacterium]
MTDPMGVPPPDEDLRRGPDGRLRCGWGARTAEYVAYHDAEWGRPVHDDVRLFEKLCLEGFQAGLSWLTILRKREAFRHAFAGFDPAKVAAFDEADVTRLLQDASIIRSRAKIEAVIANGRAMLALGETLDELVWAHAPAPGPAPTSLRALPASTPESAALAKELKRRGFRFVGATTVYAMMQACGVVNDHLAGCFVRAELARAAGRGAGRTRPPPGKCET